MFKKHFSILDPLKNDPYRSIHNIDKPSILNPCANKELIQYEINMLYIIQRNRIWFEPLITLLDTISKFIRLNDFYKLYNSKLEEPTKLLKEEKISKAELLKKIDKYINYLTDDADIFLKIFHVVKKYSCLESKDDVWKTIIQINEIN